MSETVKPCPFCGNPVILMENRDIIDNFTHSFSIHCFECGITMGDEYRDDVVAAWNRRAALSKAGKT